MGGGKWIVIDELSAVTPASCERLFSFLPTVWVTRSSAARRLRASCSWAEPEALNRRAAQKEFQQALNCRAAEEGASDVLTVNR